MKLEVESKVQQEAVGHIHLSEEPKPDLDAMTLLLLDSHRPAEAVDVVD